jgi:hypothetical protein
MFPGLDLPPRVVTALSRNGITSADTLVQLNVRELRALSGVGAGTVNVILSALEEADLALATDPWASYMCVRHGTQRADAGLTTFFLCARCRGRYADDAFSGAPPEWLATEAIEGYCAHCNEQRSDISIVQWHLCGRCERIVRSIGRGLAASKYVIRRWDESIAAHVPHIVLKETDPPELRSEGWGTDIGRKVLADFTGFSTDQPGRALFGFELKTGRKAASASGGIGKPMARFQLTTTDCDDITAVVDREHIPVYLVHVQVLGRAHPPTERFQGVDLWWTDEWAMHSRFQEVAIRPRETQNAAYYDIRMFRDISSLAEHLSSGGHIADQERLLREGQPTLYPPHDPNEDTA